jgi:hypothetical protein
MVIFHVPVVGWPRRILSPNSLRLSVYHGNRYPGTMVHILSHTRDHRG